MIMMVLTIVSQWDVTSKLFIFRVYCVPIAILIIQYVHIFHSKVM